MKRSFVLAGLVLCLAAIAAVAYAETLTLADSTAYNVSRPCSFRGKVAVVVASATASAATGSAIARGQVQIVCANKSHMRQTSTAAPTAVITDTLVPALFPIQVYSELDYFAFIKETGETDNSCYVTACR